MKILCTVTNDLTFDQRMIRICTSLSLVGHQVHLVGRQLPSSLPLENQLFTQHRFRLLFTKGKLFYLEFNIRLFFYLLFSRFDVVCSVDLDTILPGSVVAYLKRKICVYDAHEYFSEVPEVVERPFVKKAWETLARIIIPRLRYAYTVGDCLASIFQEKYTTPFEVIRNVPVKKGSVSPNSKTWDLSQNFILLYQGVLNEGRGLEETIGAMVHLSSTELWLVGEGDLSWELRELVKKLGLDDRVRFWGKLTPSELKALTPQSHLGLNLLKNKGLNYYYSLANKVFDYMQAGLPSLTMDFPEYRRINQQFEVFFLLEDLTESSIVRAVNNLRQDHVLYEKLAANCLEAAEVFTWEQEEKKLLTFFQKIEFEKGRNNFWHKKPQVRSNQTSCSLPASGER